MPKGGFFAFAYGKMQALLNKASTLTGLADLVNSRWYLLLRTLPKVAMACLARLVVGELLGVKLFSSEIVNGFSQSAIFVLAILISGVLEDYKESEGLPASLAAEVEGMSEQVELSVLLSAAEAQSSGAAPLDGPPLHAECLLLLEAIFSFLAELSNDRTCLSAISSHARLLAARLTRAGFGDQAGAVMDHAQELRSLCARIYVIKREKPPPLPAWARCPLAAAPHALTSSNSAYPPPTHTRHPAGTDFLESGTALMELLVYITIGLTITARAETFVEGLSTAAFTTLQFFYVIELLRDLDDPFEYGAQKLLPIVTEGLVSMDGAGVSAEVDLFPIMNVYARMSQRAGRVVGRADRSQDLCVVRGTGEVVRRQLAVPSAPVAARGSGKGASAAAEKEEEEEEEEEKEDGEEEVTEGEFLSRLRSTRSRVWAEVDGVDDVSSLGVIGGGGRPSLAVPVVELGEVEEQREEQREEQPAARPAAAALPVVLPGAAGEAPEPRKAEPALPPPPGGERGASSEEQGSASSSDGLRQRSVSAAIRTAAAAVSASSWQGLSTSRVPTSPRKEGKSPPTAPYTGGSVFSSSSRED